jgi:hypothetical protein
MPPRRDKQRELSEEEIAYLRTMIANDKVMTQLRSTVRTIVLYVGSAATAATATKLWLLDLFRGAPIK